METATQEEKRYWRSREVVDEEGVIDCFFEPRGFGYIAVDTGNRAERYWFHFSNFPKEQRDDIRIGRRVIFSAEGGQKIVIDPDLKKKWPRILSARFV